MAPDRLGPFTAIRRLYGGSRTEVFLARKRGPGRFFRHVAVKRVRPEYADDDRAVRGLLDEAHIQGLIVHPNVVPVHDVLVVDGAYHVVMDWVDGPNLAELLGRCLAHGGPLPVQHALLIASQVARGLHAAHTARDEGGGPAWVVHRDVSPRNILVGWDGAVRVTDFGVAQAARRLSDTRVTSVKGTPGYLSPEQASMADVDARADVFSLGCCLYQAAVGAAPIVGESPEDLVRAAREAVYDPPSRVAPHLPEGFDELIEGFLARLPRQRFADARAAEVACSRYLHHLDPDCTAADLAGFLAAVFPETPSAEEDSEDTDVYRRRE